MDILKELVSLGKELGYEGENLQKYVDRELDRFEAKAKQDRDRIERAEQRELAREKEREAREKEKEAHELEILKLKAQIPRADVLETFP